jgi:RNA polymerase sigma-70 factor (ECF subfamily)
MPDNEIRLIQRAKEGDRAAFAEIFARHRLSIYRYTLSLVGDVAVAEDVTGEVFVRLVERIDQFTYRGRPLLAWLFAIARNLVQDHYRRQKNTAEMSWEECLVAGSTNPEETVECHLTQEQLAVALARLTDKQRQVILLRFIDGLDIKSVARTLGIPASAVKSLQYRGLAALRRILEKSVS